MGAWYLQVRPHTHISQWLSQCLFRALHSFQWMPGSLCALPSCAEKALSTTLISPFPPLGAMP